jgi:hypothetical protein
MSRGRSPGLRSARGGAKIRFGTPIRRPRAIVGSGSARAENFGPRRHTQGTGRGRGRLIPGGHGQLGSPAARGSSPSATTASPSEGHRLRRRPDRL